MRDLRYSKEMRLYVRRLVTGLDPISAAGEHSRQPQPVFTIRHALPAQRIPPPLHLAAHHPIHAMPLGRTPLALALALLALAPRSGSSQDLALSLPLYRRSATDDSDRFIRARDRLLCKYAHHQPSFGPSDHPPDSLQKRQIAVPIIGTLPSSNSTLPNNGLLPNSPNQFNYSTTLRGVNDGRGGVVGLQRTFNFQADL